MVDLAGDYGTLSYLSTTKYSNDNYQHCVLHSYGGAVAENISGWCTVMGGSAADTVIGDLLLTLLWGDLLLTLLWGDLLLEGDRLYNTLVRGQQFCITCVALQLSPNYNSHHPNPSKHDGSCSFATAAGPHWQVTLQWNLPMLMWMGDTPVTWWRHVRMPQTFFF